MQDSRQTLRICVRQRLWCEDGEFTLYVRTLNASEGGLFIRTPRLPPVGRRLCISFDADGARVAATVEVVWVRPPESGWEPGAGVRFVHFDRGRASYASFMARNFEASSSAGTVAAATGDLDPSGAA